MQRSFLLPRHRLNLPNSRQTDATLWNINDALKSETIVRLCDNSQVGDNVPTFLTLIKTHSRQNFMRNTFHDKSFLESASLMRSANKDGNLAQRKLAPLQVFNLFRHLHRFLPTVQNTANLYFFALVSCTPQVFSETTLVVSNHAVGGSEDVFSGAIILLQPDDFRARKILLKFQNVTDLRTAPAVD